MSQSPFTGSEQTFEWPAEWWLADISLPPMARASAEAWNSFLLSLRGRSGTFYLGDSGAPALQSGLQSAQEVNLLRCTEMFDNAVWTKQQCTVTGVDTISSPISTLTAEAVTANGGATDAFIAQNFYAVPGKTYTFSVYLKVPSGSKATLLWMQEVRAPSFSANQAITVTTSWQRFSITAVVPLSGFFHVVIGGNGTWTTGEIDMWGAQLERGSSATTYTAHMRLQGPFVNGAGQTGKTLVCQWPGVDGALPVFTAGDYIEIQPSTGAANTRRLHKILTNQSTDISGNFTLDIFPRLRESPATLDPIQIRDCRGMFRLSSNERGWDLDEALIYGVQFSAMEAF